jgi:mono/diheme cytochrome c family protein
MQHQHSNKGRAAGLLAACAAALLLAQPALAKKTARMPASLQSLSVEMPKNDDIYPDRPGAETLDRNCLACHSSEIVMNQPALPKAVWQAEIDKMRSAYKAQIDPEDIDAIVTYLTNINGVARSKWR